MDALSWVGMSAAFATSNLARTAISFATSLVIARGVGVEDFGRWTLCTAWAAALTVAVDFGFGVLLTRDAARSDPAIGRTVAVALVSRMGALVPIAALFMLAPSYISPDPGTAVGLPVVPLIAMAGVAYGCLAPVFRAWPGALMAALAIETGGALAQWAGSWWLVQRGLGLVELLALAAMIQAVQVVGAAALWLRVAGRPDAAWPSRSVMVDTLRGAWPFAAAGLVANAQLRLAPLLLGYLAAPAAVAAFGVAARLGGVVRMLPQAAFAGALPVLSHEVRQAGPDRVRAVFDRALAAFIVAAAAVVAVFAGPIVARTYGSGFDGAVVPLVWIGIGLVPTIVNGGRKIYLYAAGHEALAVRWSAVALAVQAAACLALIPSFGAAGAAAALAVGEAAVWWPLRKAGVEPRELAGTPVGVVGDSPIVS
jgi:O-antigen/teichoic acid export membrane protein